MSEVAFKDRPYDLFISYSHKDHALVEPVARWLLDVANVRVWWDERSLGAGDTIETELPIGLSSSRGVLFAVSRQSAAAGWVQGEFGLAIKQRTVYKEFRIICLSLDGSEPPPLAATTKWIATQGGRFDEAIACQLLAGLYGAVGSVVHGTRDVYVSRSWRPSEAALADSVCQRFIKAGYRLVGDSEDHRHYDEATRIRMLIRSCSALLAIAPNRTGSGHTSKYIESEILTAIESGIPTMVVCEAGVTLADAIMKQLPIEWIFRGDANPPDTQNTFESVLETLAEEFSPPPRPHYAFYATSLRTDRSLIRNARQLIEQITGIECMLGTDLGGKGAQLKIVEMIRGALFVVADVSDGNLNTLIEAGIALGSGTPLYLLAQGEPRPTRFMFRDFEVNFYNNGLELFGALHREARKYRRRILNREMSSTGWF